MIEAVDAFIEKLGKEQNNLFDKTYEYIADQNMELAINHFGEGFKFGLLMGIETAEKSEI